MSYIKEISLKESRLCFELDSKSIALWSKNQWDSEFSKKEVKGLAIFYLKEIIGVCVFQVVIDEAQINYFAISHRFLRKGFGSRLLNSVIKKCEELNLKKLSLEVSEKNKAANAFYDCFNFKTVGKRKKYYNNEDDALLKEKILKK